MKRIIALFLITAALFMLASCTDGPLVATATPAPTAEPTPTPTPEMFYAEGVVWPETSLTKLLPPFSPTLEVATQRGDEFFFAAFTEYDSSVLTDYKTALADAGFSAVETDEDGLYIVSHADSDGKLRIQIFYDSGAGTIQIIDERNSAE